jgi:hypothetical protein
MWPPVAGNFGQKQARNGQCDSVVDRDDEHSAFTSWTGDAGNPMKPAESS